ncbi:hypothetical protein HB770_04085 [Rhizobium leguminosarum bv. viciae]|uniref:Uncharacterized protein n=1 Tax=Rhizobium leguminosarum bv. viciae TaxID=387 RepID=A0A7G6RHU3_RHILV|nr:hypothetical protein HB770_04085 [Rhizobium leguminosarum bv. viciae]
MQGKTPLTIKEILAAVDPAAGHSMVWFPNDVAIRAVTVREYLRQLPLHPSLTEMVHPTRPRGTADEVVAVIGIPAMAAFAAIGMSSSPKAISRLGDDAVLHAFLSVSEITFTTRDVDAFFGAEQKKAAARTSKRKPSEKSDEVPQDSGLLTLVRDAAEYTARSGRDGFDLSPAALIFARRTYGEVDRDQRISMARAFAAVMGDKNSAESLGDI